MTSLNHDHERQLRDLRLAYAAWLPRRIEALQEVADEAVPSPGEESPAANRAKLERLFQLAQRLCGSAAVYGFDVVSRAARRLEERLGSLIRNGSASWSDTRTMLLEQLDALRAALGEDAPAGALGSAPSAEAAWTELPLESLEARARVLLVDDDQDTLDFLALFLQAAHLEVNTALNGNNALQKVQQCLPDLIVADVNMDGMSGYELCRLVREMGHADIPFLFCTSLGASHERVSGLRMGADDYLVKGFDPEELLLKIERWVAKRSSPAAPTAPRAEPDDRPIRRNTRRQILIVDDDLEAAVSLRSRLRKKGYLVDAVDSGSEALDWIRFDLPDLVILDVVMPILSGLDVCRWIRNNPQTRLTPVILMNGRTSARDILEGEAAGADLYLKKPVVERRLTNLVEMFLSREAPLVKRTAPAPHQTLAPRL